MNDPNKQPPEGMELDDVSLDVHSIWATIQGEGPYSGVPAVFLRLAGCNLACPLCDTDYTTHRQLMLPDEVLHKLHHAASPSPSLVVVTGGEPFRQKRALATLVELIIAEMHFDVQIETNGTICPVLASRGSDPRPWDRTCIVTSPKGTVARGIWELSDAAKYVIRENEVDPNDGLPTKVLGRHNRPGRPPSNWDGVIYVQPADEGDGAKNQRNLKTTIDSCMNFGYVLCLQIQKIIGMP